ncbi:MAG: hypothetical protein AB7O38_06500 [Pirellulaceae bacterium]
MSSDASFRCPVCRATQSLRETCRRCRADLRLVVRATRRLAYVQQARELARAGGNNQLAESLTTELRWLAPGHS